MSNLTHWSEQIEGIDYHWYACCRYSGNGLRRLLNIVQFLLRIILDSQTIIRDFRPDVVIASSTYPMDNWVAYYIAKRTGARLIFELHDLWPLSPIEIGGMSRWNPFIWLCQRAENFAYRRADLVVSMLPAIMPYAVSKGLPPDRLAIVPNGISIDEWENGISQPLRADVVEAISRARSAGRYIVGYAGSHGLANSLDTLLDAAHRLREDPFQFILIGDGHERQRLMERVRSEKLVNVTMLDPLPKAQVPIFLASVDMAYLGAPKLPIYRFGVSPNKMIDYMMAKTPILYAIEAGNDPIREARCGISIKSENPEALAGAIIKISMLPVAERTEMGENGRGYALSRHTYTVLAENFINFVKQANSRE
jgi:glycosyltransferase involved in cell wall biosynthesis